VRRLNDHEGQRLQQIVRRGTGSPIRLRRAMVVLASAGGNTVPAIARLVQGDEDAIRQVIHRFNETGLASLDPRWAGGRPRLISNDVEQFIIATATTRPEKLGAPFTRWSLPKLADWLAHNRGLRRVRVSRERLRELLHKHEISFQRTRTRPHPLRTPTPLGPTRRTSRSLTPTPPTFPVRMPVMRAKPTQIDGCGWRGCERSRPVSAWSRLGQQTRVGALLFINGL
jgi:transposase